MTVFESFDDMNATELGVMKSVLDLFTAKLRASAESNDSIHPENANNETMLMIVEHIIGQGNKNEQIYLQETPRREEVGEVQYGSFVRFTADR
jgi:hypothetical protein